MTGKYTNTDLAARQDRLQRVVIKECYYLNLYCRKVKAKSCLVYDQ